MPNSYSFGTRANNVVVLRGFEFPKKIMVIPSVKVLYCTLALQTLKCVVDRCFCVFRHTTVCVVDRRQRLWCDEKSQSTSANIGIIDDCHLSAQLRLHELTVIHNWVPQIGWCSTVCDIPILSNAFLLLSKQTELACGNRRRVRQQSQSRCVVVDSELCRCPPDDDVGGRGGVKLLARRLLTDRRGEMSSGVRGPGGVVPADR